MDDINEIFKQATGADLDKEIAASSDMLVKIAEDEGLDISSLSDRDVAELVVDLMPENVKAAAAQVFFGKQAEDNDKAPPFAKKDDEKKDEKKDDDEKKEAGALPSHLTFADVSQELSKQASAEGIDLSSLSREQYHAAYEKVARDMQSPEYAQAKQAADEALAKKAEADALGVVMAQSFMRTLTEGSDKIARGDTIADNAPQTGRTLHGHRPETGREKAEGVIRKVKEVASGAASKARGADDAVQRGGAKLISKLPDALKKHIKGVTAGGARAAGYGALGAGAAALGGAAYGAKKMHDKKSVDEQALELARATLIENGIDPDSGVKIASLEVTPEVAEAALELLKKANWEIG